MKKVFAPLIALFGTAASAQVVFVPPYVFAPPPPVVIVPPPAVVVPMSSFITVVNDTPYPTVSIRSQRIGATGLLTGVFGRELVPSGMVLSSRHSAPTDFSWDSKGFCEAYTASWSNHYRVTVVFRMPVQGGFQDRVATWPTDVDICRTTVIKLSVFLPYLR